MDIQIAGVTAALSWLVFPQQKKKKKKTSCRKCPKRGCNKPTLTEDTLVDSLTS